MRTSSTAHPRGLAAAILTALAVVACSDELPDPLGPLETVGTEIHELAAFPPAPVAFDLLGVTNSQASVAEDVNNRGAVVGHWGDRAYLWRKGAFRFLPSLGGEGSRAFGLNNRNVRPKSKRRW